MTLTKPLKNPPNPTRTGLVLLAMVAVGYVTVLVFRHYYPSIVALTTFANPLFLPIETTVYPFIQSHIDATIVTTGGTILGGVLVKYFLSKLGSVKEFFTQRLTNTVSQMDDTIMAKIGETKDLIANKEALLTNKIDGVEESFNIKLATVQTSINNQANVIQDLGNQLTDKQTLLEEKARQLSDSVLKTSQLETSVSTLKKSLSQNTESMTSQFDNTLSTVTAEKESSIGSLTTELDALKTSYNTLQESYKILEQRYITGK